MSETFLELNSDPDLLISRSVDVVLLDRADAENVESISLFLSPVGKGKHFMAAV